MSTLPPLLAPFSALLLRQYEARIITSSVYTFRALCNTRQALKLPADNAMVFARALMAATGGGILVALLFNGVPAPFANDLIVMTLIVNFIVQ